MVFFGGYNRKEEKERMKTYYDLLAQKAIVKEAIKKEKRKLHKTFVALNRKTFIYLDMAVVILIIFNIGATATTNFMAVKKEPDVEVMEVNPNTAKAYDLEPHPESQQLWGKLVTYAFFLLILLGTYIYYRRNVFTEEGLFILIVFVVFFLLIYSWDFFNDFGYWLGKIIFS